MGQPTFLATRFSIQPLNTLSLSEIGGIGEVAQSILRANGVMTAEDLYNQLKNVDFDESKFKVFLKQCGLKKPRVEVIYKALKKWDEQFGTETNGSVSARVENHPGQGGRPATRRHNGSPYTTSNSSRQKTPRPFPQNDILNNSTQESVPTDAPSQSSHPLILFLEALSSVFKNIPKEHHPEFRRDILKIAEKYETINKLQ